MFFNVYIFTLPCFYLEAREMAGPSRYLPVRIQLSDVSYKAIEPCSGFIQLPPASQLLDRVSPKFHIETGRFLHCMADRFKAFISHECQVPREQSHLDC